MGATIARKSRNYSGRLMPMPVCLMIRSPVLIAAHVLNQPAPGNTHREIPRESCPELCAKHTSYSPPRQQQFASHPPRHSKASGKITSRDR
jgi:hypothetical protein